MPRSGFLRNRLRGSPCRIRGGRVDWSLRGQRVPGAAVVINEVVYDDGGTMIASSYRVVQQRCRPVDISNWIVATPTPVAPPGDNNSGFHDPAVTLRSRRRYYVIG